MYKYYLFAVSAVYGMNTLQKSTNGCIALSVFACPPSMIKQIYESVRLWSDLFQNCSDFSVEISRFQI